MMARSFLKTAWMAAFLLPHLGCVGPAYGPYGPGYGNMGGAPGYSTYPGYPGYNGGLYNGYGGYQTVPPGTNSYTPGLDNVAPSGGSTSPDPTYGPNSSPSDAPYYGSGADRVVPDPYVPGANDIYNPPVTGPGDISFEGDEPTEALRPGVNSSASINGPRLDINRVSLTNGEAPAETNSRRSSAIAALTGNHDFDSAGYRWLEGVVTYDASDRTWSIIYDLAPTADDQYGGHFVLADNPMLKVLRDGEFVRIEGNIAEQTGGQLGKPLYKITRVIQGNGRPGQ